MKFSVFVEGQTEAILTRTILEQCLPANDLYIKIRALSTGSGAGKPIRSFDSNLNASNWYDIYISPGDGSVFSSLKSRKDRLFFSGSDRILGLQDMYSANYSKLSSGKVDPELNKAFRSAALEQAQLADDRSRVHFSYAEMEVESWILSMPGLLARIDNRLTRDFIRQQLGYDLEADDAHELFLRPAQELKKIFQLVDKTYGKHISEVEMISSYIDDEIILRFFESEKSFSFNVYLKALIPSFDI